MKKIFYALCILLAGCGSTTSIVNSWKAPDAVYTPGEYQKVAVLAVVKDQGARKAAEDKLVTLNKAFHVTYPMFTNKQMIADSAKLVNMLKTEGYDAILVMRLVGKVPDTKYAQGGVNPAYQQNYIFYYTDYLNNGEYVTDMDYLIATSFYSLKQNKLLWTGLTKTSNPKKVDQLVDNVAEEVVYQMEKDKFIPGK
jgi:hypothetical protein